MKVVEGEGEGLPNYVKCNSSFNAFCSVCEKFMLAASALLFSQEHDSTQQQVHVGSILTLRKLRSIVKS